MESVHPFSWTTQSLKKEFIFLQINLSFKILIIAEDELKTFADQNTGQKREREIEFHLDIVGSGESFNKLGHEDPRVRDGPTVEDKFLGGTSGGVSKVASLDCFVIDDFELLDVESLGDRDDKVSDTTTVPEELLLLIFLFLRGRSTDGEDTSGEMRVV
ncbi:hypothetical protein HAX54_017063 [Datura stramonium]|uniref:Uncharacterized protein n=1 Tax=Datura stramonium TaxID=4076 RepID=A0ABS8ULG7_DATST|nr:hypothetical protein [Datura stramonium]